jgi:predicted NAD/FAD-dependent oxidoreductase
VIIQSFKEVMLRTKLINATDNIACVDDQFIERAQFVQNPHHFQNPTVKRSNVPDGLFLCGEHLNTSSINGALTSGLTVADEIVGILCNHR